jgi:hypothetical protein
MANKFDIIDASVKKMLSDGKIDQYDIPELILLLTKLTSENFLPKTTDDLNQQINELYDYVMRKYDLYPKNPEERATFDKVFKSSVKLVLYQPILQSKCQKFWGSLKC